MADEEKEVKEESSEEKPVKKSNKLLIIILLITGLIIGGGGAAAFLILKNMKSDVSDPKTSEDISKDGEGVAKKPDPDKLGPIKELDPFIVNLSGSAGRNYLKLEMALEFDKVEVATEVDNKLPQIKDTILLLLSTKSFEDIQSAEGKLMLKNEILTRLNKYLNTGMIQNLYFTNFVVQ